MKYLSQVTYSSPHKINFIDMSTSKLCFQSNLKKWDTGLLTMVTKLFSISLDFWGFGLHLLLLGVTLGSVLCPLLQILRHTWYFSLFFIIVSSDISAIMICISLMKIYAEYLLVIPSLPKSFYLNCSFICNYLIGHYHRTHPKYYTPTVKNQ